jgi:hypothetical protein
MDALNNILEFSVDGKLEKLCLAGYPNLLHEWDQEVELGSKYFRPAGWDECFPTIDAYQTSPVMGELIGLRPEINCQATFVEQIWHTSRFEARRRFSIETSSCIEMSFHVTNTQHEPIEFLWASHALFSVNHLRKISMANGGEYVDFDVNQSEEKIFLPNLGAVEFVYPNFKTSLTSDQAWWGIWINRGGWPEDNPKPLCCVGVEATNTAGEYPNGQWLQANATFAGKVQLEIHAEPPA